MEKFTLLKRINFASPAIVNTSAMREPFLVDDVRTKYVFEAIEHYDAASGIVLLRKLDTERLPEQLASKTGCPTLSSDALNGIVNNVIQGQTLECYCPT